MEIRLETNLKELLKKSERNYFRAGGVAHVDAFFSCYQNPDFSDYPLWNVAFLDRYENLPQGFIQNMESIFKKHKIPYIRVYSEENEDVLNHFMKAGYKLTLEKGYIWKPGYKKIEDKLGIPEIELQEVVTPEDWISREHKFDDMNFPDGKNYTAAAWNRFEKIKVNTGIMKSYMIIHNEDHIGTISIIMEGDFLRLKNIYIRKSFRRQGYATAVLKYFKHFILAKGLLGFGAFVVHESPGTSAYERNGMQWKVSQWECTRSI